FTLPPSVSPHTESIIREALTERAHRIHSHTWDQSGSEEDRVLLLCETTPTSTVLVLAIHSMLLYGISSSSEKSICLQLGRLPVSLGTISSLALLRTGRTLRILIGYKRGTLCVLGESQNTAQLLYTPVHEALLQIYMHRDSGTLYLRYPSTLLAIQRSRLETVLGKVALSGSDNAQLASHLEPKRYTLPQRVTCAMCIYSTSIETGTQDTLVLVGLDPTLVCIDMPRPDQGSGARPLSTPAHMAKESSTSRLFRSIKRAISGTPTSVPLGISRYLSLMPMPPVLPLSLSILTVDTDVPSTINLIGVSMPASHVVPSQYGGTADDERVGERVLILDADTLEVLNTVPTPSAGHCVLTMHPGPASLSLSPSLSTSLSTPRPVPSVVCICREGSESSDIPAEERSLAICVTTRAMDEVERFPVITGRYIQHGSSLSCVSASTYAPSRMHSMSMGAMHEGLPLTLAVSTVQMEAVTSPRHSPRECVLNTVPDESTDSLSLSLSMSMSGTHATPTALHRVPSFGKSPLQLGVQAVSDDDDQEDMDNVEGTGEYAGDSVQSETGDEMVVDKTIESEPVAVSNGGETELGGMESLPLDSE
ncbi:hypothetical protein KIPB_007024, partial [Kipferlia bialata]